MIDADQLQKLQQLRDDGVLTQEEFQSQKHSLLNRDAKKPLRSRNVLLLTVLAATSVAGTVGYLAAQTPTSDQAAEVPGMVLPAPTSQTAKAVTNLELASTKEIESQIYTPTPVPTAGFEWAASSHVIGLNPAFVESKFGTPREKSGGSLIFEVQGCVVGYKVVGTKIVSVFANVNAKCQPVVDGRKITPSTTFGSLMGPYSKLVSTCVFNCGNAYDPTIDLFTPGYNANGFFDVVYQGDYGDVPSTAMDTWANAIRRQHGLAEDDWQNADASWFECVSNAPPEVTNAMRAGHITGVLIGRNLGRCGSGS